MRALFEGGLEIGLPFLGFLAAALLVSLQERRGRDHRPFVHFLIAATVLGSVGLALVGRNAWPFSKWPLVAGRVGEQIEHPRFLAVDAAGREHDVDWRAWQPLSVLELSSWSDSHLPRLEPEARERVLRYLLERAEAGRRRALRGERIGTFDDVLGPFTAPLFVLHPNLWSPPERTPPEPFVGLRLYLERWNPERRAALPPDSKEAVERELLFEVLPR